MNSELSGRDIVSTIMSFIDKFTDTPQPSRGRLDAFHREISQLEQQLAKRVTSPLEDVRRCPPSTESITEQQKIMDMSG